jgi:glycosyltransferase involved in cell wall biosynthesis
MSAEIKEIGEGNTSRADLHVHSKYSNRPSEWFLRRIGAPESYIEPRALYENCRRRGMDFVTISDHNCIGGSLEIADLPGTFISSEITTYFPEDGCKIHCLVLGINERSFADIMDARENIYDLQRYLTENRIAHSIAHPLFRVNDRLTIDHFEKLLLMFNNFEVLNGSRHIRAGNVTRAIVESLSPALLEELANRHGIEPLGEEPWKKGMTGGSDDHSGLYSAEAFSETPHASNVFDFIENLRCGDMKPAGRGGSSVRLAHSLYKIAYSYYTSALTGNGKAGSGILAALMKKISEPVRKQSDPEKISLRKAIKRRLRNVAFMYREKNASPIETAVITELSNIFRETEESDGAAAPREGSGLDTPEDQQRFQVACRVSQQLSFRFFEGFLDTIKRGRIVEALQSLFSIAPIAMGVAPYLTAFGAQHKDEEIVSEIAGRFEASRHLQFRTGRRAWVTDTFSEVNGVSMTINRMCSLANSRGDPITAIVCCMNDITRDFPVKRFAPVGTYRLPEYESQEITIPPLLEIVAYIEEQGFDELIISTPGPLGLCAMLAARLLNIRRIGIYHTDFPGYVAELTDDDSLAEAAWQYMRWFYGGMQLVHVPSLYYKRMLEERGLVDRNINILPRGVDRELYNPSRRNERFWEPYGLNGEFKYIYVGRISQEKNIEVMLEAYRLIQSEKPSSGMIVVGDGPALKEMKERFSDSNVIFTGYLHGEELAAAYASADAFVFPSMSDTYGNAVLEAHACGLPAIVSDRGGPAEIVSEQHSGIVVDASQPQNIAEAMRRLGTDESLYLQLRSGALKKAEHTSWNTALDLLDPRRTDCTA